jgi:hypothetical protein
MYCAYSTLGVWGRNVPGKCMFSTRKRKTDVAEVSPPSQQLKKHPFPREKWNAHGSLIVSKSCLSTGKSVDLKSSNIQGQLKNSWLGLPVRLYCLFSFRFLLTNVSRTYPSRMLALSNTHYLLTLNCQFHYLCNLPHERWVSYHIPDFSWIFA